MSDTYRCKKRERNAISLATKIPSDGPSNFVCYYLFDVYGM